MKGMQLLLVEDDALSASALVVWLERQGVRVTHVTDIDSAEVALSSVPFDVLLSDVYLPGNRSLAWIERIALTRPALPIALLTGHPDVEIAIKAANLHVAAFIVKPPDFTELGELLAGLHATVCRHRLAHASLKSLRAALVDGASLDRVGLDAALCDLANLLPDLEADPRAFSGSPQAATLRVALADAVRVIEQTKHSFRSRELGQLRQRLLLTLSG